MAMVSGGATRSTIRTLVTAAVKFPKSETKVRNLLRIITSAVTRHEKDSLVTVFVRHKLHESLLQKSGNISSRDCGRGDESPILRSCLWCVI